MSNEMMTAEQALSEVLNRAFGNGSLGWRNLSDFWRSVPVDHPVNVTLRAGDLRRWSAPLLAKEVSDARR